MNYMDNKETFYCLIVGSRTFNNYELLKEKTNKLLSNQQNRHIIVVSGGARGADKLAEQYAKEYGYENVIMPANWNLYGKSAGFVRNREMHEYIAKYPHRGVIAFWDGKSRGTEHSFELSKEYNNPIRVIKF